ncbi:MAG: tetratricopeptide repeat protein, partial [Bacteroidetes bacterium]|nr:tetratricopeptide repeat protein [Bacteroidota bacterium]
MHLKKLLLIPLSFFIFTASSQETNPCLEAGQLINNFQYEKALKVLNENCMDKSANTFFVKGICNFKLGRYNAAQENFDASLALDSNHLPALSNLGKLYQSTGKHASALMIFKKLIQIDSLNSYYYKQTAYSANRLGDFTNAIFYYQNSIALNPEDFEAAASLIDLYLIMEDFEEADILADKMLKLDLENISIIQKKAKTAYKLKDYKHTYKHVNALLSLGDSNSY